MCWFFFFVCGVCVCFFVVSALPSPSLHHHSLFIFNIIRNILYFASAAGRYHHWLRAELTHTRYMPNSSIQAKVDSGRLLTRKKKSTQYSTTKGSPSRYSHYYYFYYLCYTDWWLLFLFFVIILHFNFTILLILRRNTRKQHLACTTTYTTASSFVFCCWWDDTQ